MEFVKKYFDHASFQRRAALVFLYSVLFAASLFAAFVMRFDFASWNAIFSGFLFTFFWIIPLKITFLVLFKHFEGMLTYFRIPDLVRLFQALFFASCVIFAVVFLSTGLRQRVVPSGTNGELRPAEVQPSVRLAAPFLPRGVILADLLFSLILVGGFRIGLRMIRERYSNKGEIGVQRVRMAILGAGDVGASLAVEWLAKPGLGRMPVVFLDDDKRKHGLQVHGIPVVGSIDRLAAVQKKYGIQEAVIAISSASAKRVQEIVALAKAVGIKTEIMPSLVELATGQVKASRIRPVDIQDLLGRDVVPLDNDSIRNMIYGKTVLVTGAGGSIGSELCRQIALQSPLRLLLVERCEVQLFQIEQNLLSLGFGGIIQPLVGDITDEARMRHILQLFKPQIIFHAAAHKHVFMMERQPWEAVKNNSFGTRLLADLAIECDVERFVFISTDKAINPTNVMGASKRLAEIYLQAKQHSGNFKTKFMAVRFGNVLGSSGSVIPIFRQQIAEGGPVKVTHPEVTRYFMTIPEAVGLVLQCSILGQGGEIFVLDMGKPVKIVDLARQMIELSGFRPEIDIPIEFIGLRPGEKLYEELQHKDETHQKTDHPQVMRFVSEARPLDAVCASFQQLHAGLHEKSANAIKRDVQEIVPEYQAHLSE